MSPCEKIDLYSLTETSIKLEGREFIRSAQKSELEELLKKNITVFLPTDASFTEFAENALESVSSKEIKLEAKQFAH